jgi:hypothetical protein
MSTRQNLSTLLATFCVGVCATTVPGTWEGSIVISGQTGELRVSSVRCLASAVYTLWRRYGLPLTYEDVPLKFKGDLIDVTSPTYNSTGPDDRAYNPRGGPLYLPFRVSGSDATPVNPRQLLIDLLNTYKASRYPGYYEVRYSENGAFHIVPVSTLNAAGQIEQVTPIMDTKITLPQKPGRSTGEVVNLIVAFLNDEVQTKVVLGRPLNPTFERSVFPDGLSNIPIRDLLERTFEKSGGHRLWLLLWDPTFHRYVLSIF